LERLDATVFQVTAAISLIACLLVVTRRNPVYSAIFMVLFFTMISLDFLILRAPFLAVIQVLVYAGAIMVLYLFVIMLLNLKPEEFREEVTFRRKLFAAFASGGLFILLARAIRASGRDLGAIPLTGAVPESARESGEVSVIAGELFRHHALAFELTSILILVAIIGAIYLTKKRGAPPAAAPEGIDDHAAHP
jgi:NADH-quinone oxidoreductase subunit J